MKNPKFEDTFLMTSSVAREFGVSSQAIILWEKTGKLSAIRTERGVRLFRRSEVERLKRERVPK
jgi:DNA-binding transcriptional MerR regulator